MKIRLLDKILYFFLKEITFPIFWILSIYSCVRIDNLRLEKTWLHYVLIYFVPLFATLVTLRIRQWLFFSFARVLKEQIENSGLLDNVVFDNTCGYKYRVNQSLADNSSQIYIYCDYDKEILTAEPNCHGGQSHKIRFYSLGNLNSIINFIKKKEVIRRKRHMKMYGYGKGGV